VKILRPDESVVHTQASSTDTIRGRRTASFADRLPLSLTPQSIGTSSRRTARTGMTPPRSRATSKLPSGPSVPATIGLGRRLAPSPDLWASAHDFLDVLTPTGVTSWWTVAPPQCGHSTTG
jgi:hypothetical protein